MKKRFIAIATMALLLGAAWANEEPKDTLTAKQTALLEQLDSTSQPSSELLNEIVSSLNDDQLKMLASVAPGVKITPELIGQFYNIAYDDTRSLDERGQEIRKLIGLQKPGDLLVRKICIWDPIGKAGPIFQAALDQKARTQAFGIDLDLIPYTDEKIATIDLKAGQCDAALISGLRARTLNKFTGTIDSIGGIRSDQEMHTLLYVLSRPAMAKKMVQGPFVTLGIAQGGAAYVFVNDKRISSLAKAAGKKVAVLGYDPVQAEMVAQIGATPVPSTLLSAPNKFNNGVVDVLAAPLVAYNAMELYKGMDPNGGIIDYPLAQITIQLIGWRHRIPNAVGQLIREAFFESYDTINDALNSEVADIPEHWWVQIPESDKDDYEGIMQQARITLREKDYYSGEMLSLQRKIRCRFAPERAECSQPIE